MDLRGWTSGGLRLVFQLHIVRISPVTRSLANPWTSFVPCCIRGKVLELRFGDEYFFARREETKRLYYGCTQMTRCAREEMW